jgi:hypothetical protein
MVAPGIRHLRGRLTGLLRHGRSRLCNALNLKRRAREYAAFWGFRHGLLR